ncbi:LysR substrate-binding domain-containing protein [Actinomyces oris]|uniref:LysR substrate-binding domain-containing protein n=1 Tax=Actinomyces oris TaxID=544580 RepID=UPI0028EA30E4|nr:LysR substrate-binding domain-containing protein [Actinomyces oris]
MELQQLRYAVAIAEEQSFTRAAQRCFVVQSALSRQIKSLESELGVRLFARTSRKVEVTPAGEAFVKQARLCLQAAERAKASAAAAHGQIRGSLTIGVIPTVTAVDIAAVLGAFRRSYPEVGVHVRTGGSDEFLRRIAAGQLDVGVLGLAEGVTPRGVQMRELSQERLVAVLSERHRLAGRRRLRLKDLADEPFVDFPEGSSGREQSDLAFDRARLRREVSLEVNTADLLTGLVRQGLGVALVAPSVAREAPGCVCIPVSDGPVRVEYLAWDSFNPSPVAQVFVDSILMPTGQRPLSLTATTA